MCLALQPWMLPAILAMVVWDDSFCNMDVREWAETIVDKDSISGAKSPPSWNGAGQPATSTSENGHSQLSFAVIPAKSSEILVLSSDESAWARNKGTKRFLKTMPPRYHLKLRYLVLDDNCPPQRLYRPPLTCRILPPGKALVPLRKLHSPNGTTPQHQYILLPRHHHLSRLSQSSRRTVHTRSRNRVTSSDISLYIHAVGWR